MIIFDLDGTLADCEHRRHFVDPSKRNPNGLYMNEQIYDNEEPTGFYFKRDENGNRTNKPFNPDWRSFNESCSEDTPIQPTINIFNYLYLMDSEIQIWSGRCESVREKTERWLNHNVNYTDNISLKMRPIGDSTPDDQLKERWLEETYQETKWGRKTPIEYVFDDRPKVIRMWRRHGIFVFNCCQHDEEF